jgi:hemoglobin
LGTGKTENYGGGMGSYSQHQETPLTTGDLSIGWRCWFWRDELFAGERAEFVRKKALEIGQMMNGRLNG